jgi:hypothetical protein
MESRRAGTFFFDFLSDALVIVSLLFQNRFMIVTLQIRGQNKKPSSGYCYYLFQHKTSTTEKPRGRPMVKHAGLFGQLIVLLIQQKSHPVHPPKRHSVFMNLGPQQIPLKRTCGTISTFDCPEDKPKTVL